MKRVKRSYLGEDRMTCAHRLALVWMAQHALDGKGKNPDDLPGIYWGGHHELGLEVYGATPKPDTRKRNTRRLIRDLIELKLIEVWDTPEGGRVAYRLLPNELDGGGSIDPRGGGSIDPGGGGP